MTAMPRGKVRPPIMAPTQDGKAEQMSYTRFRVGDRVTSSEDSGGSDGIVGIHGTVIEVFGVDHPDNSTSATAYDIAWDDGQDSGCFESDADLMTECPNCGCDAINTGVCLFCGEGSE